MAALHHPHRPDERERGAVLVFMALAMGTLMIIAALAIDGGAAYSQRRQMQNAADAAAMAGARAVGEARFAGKPVADVEDVVDQIAQSHGAESWTCQIVNSAGTPIGACSDAAAVTSSVAHGVQVRPTDVRDTTFGTFAGIETVAASTQAIAVMQRLVGYAGAQFAVCSSGPGGSYDLLNADNTINATKASSIGKIALMGAQIYKNDAYCAAVPGGGGGAGSFKGEIDQELLVVGDEVTASSAPGTSLPGNWSDNLIRCPGDSAGNSCLLLPVTGVTSGSGTGASMRVVGWAFWRATTDTSGCYSPGSGVVKLCGTFVAPSGSGSLPPDTLYGTGDVSASDIRKVALID